MELSSLLASESTREVLMQLRDRHGCRSIPSEAKLTIDGVAVSLPASPSDKLTS
jgi:hypothetical protein